MPDPKESQEQEPQMAAGQEDTPEPTAGELEDFSAGFGGQFTESAEVDLPAEEPESSQIEHAADGYGPESSETSPKAEAPPESTARQALEELILSQNAKPPLDAPQPEQPSPATAKNNDSPPPKTSAPEPFEPPAIDMPAIPKYVRFNDEQGNEQVYATDDMLASLSESERVVLTLLARQQASEIVSEALKNSGMVRAKDIERLEARLAREEFYNTVDQEYFKSTGTSISSRAHDADPKFADWLGKQSAQIRAMAATGDAPTCALIIRTYVEDQVAERNREVDARRQSERERQIALHAAEPRRQDGTPRDSKGQPVAAGLRRKNNDSFSEGFKL
jgi:hypothetical protein